jgi:hypothetical protein
MAAVLAALFTVAAPADAGTQKKSVSSCPPPHSRVLLADEQAQVFELPESGPGPFRREEVGGCAYHHGRAFMFGEPLGEPSPQGNSGVSSETLAGAVVAYESSFMPAVESRQVGGAVIVVRDLRSGRVLHKVPSGTSSGGLGIGPALSLVVKSDGAVAWTTSALPQDGYYQVHALDKSGSRMLAIGESINPYSLALAGSTLYWTQEGKPFSAPLN